MATVAATKSSSNGFGSYIFGYGSLICPHSRVLTAPTLAGKKATPVKIHHFQRQWSAPFGGWIAMGIIQQPGASCVGVLLPVDEEEIAQFDIRELGYDRVQIPNEHVHQVDFLADNDNNDDSKEQEHYDHEHCYFRQQSNDDNSSSEDAPAPTIWVYVQQDPESPSPDSPIVQSYVDIILRGCLSISQDFAREFLLTTEGWRRAHEGGGGGDVYWVDDRHDPLYPRAVPEYSQKNGPAIDQLLEAHRPLEFSGRRPFVGSSTC